MGLYFNIVNSIGIANFQWHSQNKNGNIGILALWSICEKLYLNYS